jgi:flagella basal body P-ring formation protein FlgA
MIRILAILLWVAPAAADTVVAARTIPAQSLIRAEDVAINTQTVPGGVADPGVVIGMEARVALFAGRPIRVGDIGVPAVVDRNQIVPLLYQGNGLMISTDGRALARGAAGDLIRVMNLSSRATVTARIGSDGAAYVQN